MQSIFEFWTKVFGAVSDRTRLIVLIALYDSKIFKKTPHCLTFSELQEITQMPKKSALEYHLKMLLEAGLIQHEKRHPYEITDDGIDVLKSLGVTEQLIRAYETRNKQQ